MDSIHGDYSCWWEHTSQTQGSMPLRPSSIETETSLDAVLETADGDKVEISIDSRQMAENYNVIGRENQQATNSIAIFGESFTNAALTVSGNIDAEEEEDISKALQTIDRMMAAFKKGNIDKAVSLNGDFAQLSTLAMVDADMEKATTVSGEEKNDPYVALSERLIKEKEERKEEKTPLDDYMDQMLSELLSNGLSTDELMHIVNDGLDSFTEDMPAIRRPTS